MPCLSYALKDTRDEARVLDRRLILIFWIWAAAVALITVRLFILMVWQHDFYRALAAGSHEMYSQLFPARGKILAQDSRTGEEYPLAINRDLFIMFADTRQIKDLEQKKNILDKLSEILSYDEEKKKEISERLNKPDDPYEPLDQKMEEEIVEKIKILNLPGIGFVRRPQRFYPENRLAAQTVGFLGKDEKDGSVGRYGTEGYWQGELAGNGGFLEGSRSALGNLIPLAGKFFQPSMDGADILLTIDRTVQFEACERLRKAKEFFEAETASLLILDPFSGAIRAMCSLPDFDPNEYGKAESAEVFNNTTIFTPYEPGSIMKPLVMAAAINEEKVQPSTVFFDTGSREGVCDTPIKNAESAQYGDQTMTGVLENSINTGMVFVAERLGKKTLREYVSNFGFGIKTGVELDTENSGTVESLAQGDKFDCYSATASFGQGFSATPLQMITAFATLANGGKLMKPYIVEEIRYANGKIEKRQPQAVREVISSRTAHLLSGMLTSVVDNGKAAVKARVPGYYVAGKSGTAQIAGRGGYSEETDHSFVGFAPVDKPVFVMLVKFGKPKRKYAESTSAPVFGEIADFLLKYYQVPPNR